MTGIFSSLRKLTKIDKEPNKGTSPKAKKSLEVLQRSLKVLSEATRETVNDEKTIHALQSLYRVTEKEDRTIKVDLVQQQDSRLVPLLLHLLTNLCPPKTHAHNLALVILNNLSTETENQRYIALDCNAVRILCQLLCEDPSCHLLAICLVNLSFCSAEIRQDWVRANKKLQWMETLTYCIQVGSMTWEEYHLVQPFLEETSPIRRTPAEYLSILQADRRTPSSPSNSRRRLHETLPTKEDQLFPETVRWCLCILKNLTRPHPKVNVSDLVFTSGVVPFLFQCITLCHVKSQSPVHSSDTTHPPGTSDPADDYNVVPSPSTATTSSSSSCPVLPVNSPETWEASSSEDAALYVLMNLSAKKENRQRLVDLDAVLLLSLITQFAESHDRDGELELDTPDHLRIMDFQSLKARIALAFILASNGHFEQSAQVTEQSDLDDDDDRDALALTKVDILQLLELLANTLHSREKAGAGGYLAYTMSPKMVIRAIRCLLVELRNQMQFSQVTGTRLNSLLLKAIAMHVFGGKPIIDVEAAEDAVMTLYLQSCHGFKFPFLPSIYAGRDPSKGTAVKILAAFARTKSVNPAAKHAAQQLVERMSHLRFGSSDRDASLSSGTFEISDFLLPSNLLKMTKTICLPSHTGAKSPRQDLFNRPVYRKRVAPWTSSSVEWYPNVLIAVQDIVFDSLRKEPKVAVDDFSVADAVASCADGNIAEAFHFLWVWEDDSTRIKSFMTDESFALCSAGQKTFTSSLLQRTVGNWASCGPPQCSPHA